MATSTKKTKATSKKKKKSAALTYYKCTRADGTDFRTGEVNYAAALASGKALVHPDPQGKTGEVCGRGFHVSSTPRKTIQFAERWHRPYRWFEVSALPKDVIEEDEAKARVRRLRVVREISLADIFGPDFAARIDQAKTDAATWKEIKWLEPADAVSEDRLTELFEQWYTAITPWLNGRKVPKKVRLIRDRATAAADAAAADAATAATAAAAAAAAAADAADAAADADADAAAAAAADDAAAAADDAADDAADVWHVWWIRWYVRPRYVLWRSVRWRLAGMDRPNPWEPLVEIFKIGCLPIGYSGGAFVIYWPKAKA